jgi:hypothetical protein
MALLCLVSFANAEYFAPQSAEEVTHYSATDNFICSRETSDDRADMSGQQTLASAQLQSSSPSLDPLHTVFSQRSTSWKIRGPPSQF